MNEDVPTGYNDEALADLRRGAQRWRNAGKDAYIFMINGAKVRAPAAALALQERVEV